ncbi:MAG: spore germination protein [Clostridia bacterium]|nr:spore germination protein [Clostridia bacterium]
MSGQIADYKNCNLSGNLERDVALFKDIFKKDVILRVKEITARGEKTLECALVYMDGMTDSDQINEAIIRPLITVGMADMSGDIADFVGKQMLFARDVKKISNIAEILQGVLYGEALLLINGSKNALMMDVKGFRTRGITEPMEERILQGPREGFEEAALLNLAMIRRKLLTPDLCIEMLRVGRRTSTAVFVCYLGTLADQKTVEKIKQKIGKINIDGILDTNYIVEQISGKRFSLFKRNGTTERPDIVAARLLEGRIAIVVDGTPMVVTIPYLFSENFQSDEDYYQNFLLSSAERCLRYFCFFLSISIPAVFIAISTFHRQLLPTSFAISVMQLRGGVPFTPVSECIIMILVFEILKEAGIRMSQNLGHALSIVGGLVVGQAAVEARIISSPILITVALSGIAGLMLPRLKTAVFYLRIAFVLLSAFLGLYGYIMGAMLLGIYILSIYSYSTDYTVSLKKASLQSLKDTLFRASWKNMKERPLFNRNISRQGKNK